MGYAKELLENYKTKIEMYFSQYEEKSMMKKLNKDMNEADFYEFILTEINKIAEIIGVWETSPIEELDGLVPKDYIESISDFETVLEIYKVFAEKSDFDLPYVLLEKLKSFGELAVNTLFEFINDLKINGFDEGSNLALTSIRTFGKWKLESSIEPLMELLYELIDEEEVIQDTIVVALKEIGTPVIDSCIKRLDSADIIGSAEEYIMDILVSIGASNKSDKIYKCLKNVFLKMEYKALGAVLLGDYGDGRIIPALRGYLLKNIYNIDKQTFDEIRGAVLTLGGTMDDIESEFGNLFEDIEYN